MEKLLEKYLKSYSSWDNIFINHWNIDGAICTVNYYTDESRHYKEIINVNIWDMLIFLNK